MRKLLKCTLLLALSLVLGVSANLAIAGRKSEVVSVGELAAMKSVDGKVLVQFDIYIPQNELLSREARIYKPIFVNKEWSQELPAVKVEGRNYQIVKSDQERFDKKDLDSTAYLAVYDKEKKSMVIPYEYQVDFSPNLKGSDIIVTQERTSICRGACFCSVCEKVDTLARIGAGVVDFSDFFTYDQRFYLKSTYDAGVITEDFNNSSIFAINTDDIIEENFNNPYEALVSRLNDLMSIGSVIDSVNFVVASSPDGPLAKNIVLTDKRLAKMKEIANKTLDNLSPNLVKFYGVNENWDAMVDAMVAADIMTDECSEIIANEEDLDKREASLAKSIPSNVLVEIYGKLRNCKIVIDYGKPHELSDLIFDGSYVGINGSNTLNLDLIKAEYEKEKNPTTINNMMVAYTILKEYDKAYELSTQLNISDAQITNNKAVLYSLMGDYPFAEFLLLDIADVMDVQNNLALNYVRLGDFEKASTVYGCDRSINSIAVKLAAGQYEEAAELTMSESYPSPELMYLRSLAYSYTEKPELTLFTLKQACEMDAKFKEYAKNQAEFIPFRECSVFTDIVK